MAKFKKLAILCVSLMMTAAVGTAVGCGDDTSSSSSSSSSSSPAEATEYTVTVTKPDNVTINGTLTAEEGEDVTFTATVDASYVLAATGATQVGDPTTADGKTTYTYKVAEIAANTAVTITATKKQFTVTVTKPDEVTIAGTLTADEGADVTFTATVDASYVLTATGATQVGDATEAEGNLTYTYKVSAIAANTAVTIEATQIHLSGILTEMNTNVSIPAGGSFTGTLQPMGGIGDYTVQWNPMQTNLVVKYMGSTLPNGATITVKNPMMFGPTQLVFTTSDGTALNTNLLISVAAPDPYEVDVGEVDVNVVNAQAGQIVYFQVEEAGDYRIRPASGETNAMVALYDMQSEMPDEFLDEIIVEDLTTSDTTFLFVSTANFQSDTINLIIEKYEPQEIAACYEKVGATRSKTVVVNTSTDETLNLEAGLYYIARANENTSINGYPYIMIEAAGETTISVKYADWNYEYGSTSEVTAQYDVYKVKTATATNSYGTATLLSNAYTPFTFSVAEAGVYAFEYDADNITLALWNDEWSEYSSVSYSSPYYFVATEANQQFTVYAYKYDENHESYDFEWDITKVTPTVLSVGSNVHTMAKYDVLVTSFTATEAGAYCIAAGDYICVGTYADGTIVYDDGDYNYNYGDFYFDLEAGQTIYLFLNFDNYETEATMINQDFAVSRYGAVGERPKVATPINVYFDTPTSSTIYANSEANELGLALNLYGNGDFTLTWNNTNVAVYVNGSLYTQGDKITLSMWGTPPTVVAHNSSSEDVECNFLLEVYKPELNNNSTTSVEISPYQGAIAVRLQVTEGRTYTFSVNNAWAEVYTVNITDYSFDGDPADYLITSFEAEETDTVVLYLVLTTTALEYDNENYKYVNENANGNIEVSVVITEENTSNPIALMKWTKNY